MIIRRSRPGDMELTPDGSEFVAIGSDEWTETKIGLRLGFWLGEWFMDTREGVPYVQTILGQKTPTPVIRAIFWDALERTTGVINVLTVDVLFDQKTRELSIDWSVLLAGGKISRPGNPFIIQV